MKAVTRQLLSDRSCQFSIVSVGLFWLVDHLPSSFRTYHCSYHKYTAAFRVGTVACLLPSKWRQCLLLLCFVLKTYYDKSFYLALYRNTEQSCIYNGIFLSLGERGLRLLSFDKKASVYNINILRIHIILCYIYGANKFETKNPDFWLFHIIRVTPISDKDLVIQRFRLYKKS